MMEENKIFEHQAYYLFELLVLIVGFIMIAVLSFSIIAQFVTLIFVLMTYICMGFLHHHFNHDLRAKIVLEYVLISVLVMGAFLFLNAGRL